ncbi:group II intron maturase-specific domain-containing protein [Alicyclobacillus tolerans]|uniref:group II intron maturase-specific domain-containing protein n=1 Tax=Alicyclobacillus tolerans TaxID=90970 RepID=UPI00351C8555
MKFEFFIVFLCHVAHPESPYSYILDSLCPLFQPNTKSVVDRPWKRKFLGFSFTHHRQPKVRVSPKSLKRFKDKFRITTKRSRGQSRAERLDILNKYLHGWSGYYRRAETRSVFVEQDEWIRRRLRMC